MEIQLRTSGSVTILDLSGNLTIGRSEENLRETVKRLIDEERKFLLLNLSEVPAIDSSGIGAMIKSFTSVKEANGKLKRSEEHTSELQSQSNLVCRLLLEKKNKT